MSQTTMPAKTGNNVPAKVSPVITLRNLLERQRGEIARVLPKHLTPEKMIRVALTAVQGKGELLECDPIEIVGCVMQAAELGLELSGPLGQAYMVTYKSKHTQRRHAQFQMGYRGLLRLAYNSGMVLTFHPEVVYQDDEFQCWKGTRPGIRHVQNFTSGKTYKAGTRDGIIAVYAVCQMRDGASDFEIMTADQLEAHRRRYSRASGDDSPWNTAWPEQAKKTVIKRLAKRVPLSSECFLAMKLDDRGERIAADGEVIEHGPTLDVPLQTDPAIAPEVLTGEFPEDEIGDAKED